MNKQIELLQGQVDHRGNFYPSGIYKADELPDKIKNDNQNPHIVEYKKNKKNDTTLESKEIYNPNNNKQLKPKTNKIVDSKQPEPELKKEDKTPRENKSTKTTRVKKEEVL